MHDILNKVVDYDTRKEKPKIVCIFWYDSNYDIFSRLYAKSSKLYTHWKTHIYTTWLTQNMWSMGENICIFNNKLQKISFKKNFIWKSEKGLKMTHCLFVK